MAVELRPVPEEGRDRLDCYVDGRRIAALSVGMRDASLCAGVFPDPRTDFSLDDLVVLVRLIDEYARSQRAQILALASPSVLIRSLARRLGFHGALRDPVVRDLQDHWPDVAQLEDADGSYHGDLVGELRGFGIRAATPRRAGPIARVGRRLSGGVNKSIDVDVEWWPGRSFRLGVPDTSDLMEEAVARCADTAVAVLRRLAPASDVVHEIRFDRSSAGLVSGTEGGHARGQTYDIHLNVGYCAAYASLELRRTQLRASPQGVSSGATQLPYTVIDATVAHEIWHLVESDFDARSFADVVEFRRELGRELGVETLEQAVRGGGARAPAAWQHAHARLVTEVSPYGATNAAEATAEMFKAWWCRTGDPTPVVARFGELLGCYFPEGRGDSTS